MPPKPNGMSSWIKNSALTVHRLGVAQQQMVEIAKPLSQDARILVMDEPTAALSDRETEFLFAMIARLKKNGVAIVYISHRLAEVFVTQYHKCLSDNSLIKTVAETMGPWPALAARDGGERQIPSERTSKRRSLHVLFACRVAAAE
jgi:energy-coupling factor transporter ATP-binding protein EcfA2